MTAIDAKEIEKAKILLKDCPQQIQVAAASAINRTATMVKTEVSKTIRKNYLISAKDIKSTLSINRASRSKLTGEISSRGRAPLLTAFKVKTYKKRGPLRVQVLKNGKAAPVRGLFLGISRKGYVGAMQRKNISRYPLRVPHGPSVPQMFSAERSMSVITPFAEETLNKRFIHEVEFRLSKYGGR